MRSMKPVVVLGVAAAAALIAGFALRQPEQTPFGHSQADAFDAKSSVTSSVPAAAPRSTVPQRPAASYAAASTDGPERGSSARAHSGSVPASTALPPPVVAPDAAQHLADALRYGDERSPPIVADALPIERATAAELADPAAYRRYEQRSQAKLYRAFEQEAVIALNDIDRDIQRARAAGLTPEQIAEGEEKQRRLAETLERLRQGQLGKE